MIYDSSWEALFTTIKSREYYLDLLKFWDEEYSNFICFPKKDHIFNAFNLTKQNDVKVVIVGQDPYHEPGQAMGLSFSVPDGVKLPPSLVNIYKELEIEYQTTIDKSSGDLTYLAKQGVLMINSILSVRNGEALSHNIKQYSLLFKDILFYLNSLEQPIAFLLWGNHAKKYSKFLNNDKHLILYANHPSPLSANRGGWFNCNHFVKANEFLSANNIQTIDWIKK
jgi:uracil-DNA glycosylase